MAKKEFTNKQAAFIKEYQVDFNATQAAIRAGYSKRSAMQIGEENLRKPDISALLKAEIEARAKRTDLTIDRVLLEYKRLALFDLRKAFDAEGALKPIHELDDDTAAALAGIESDDIFEGFDEDRKKIGVTRKIKTYDKRAALADVMRHLGGFAKDNEQQGEAAAKATSAAMLAALSLQEAIDIYRQKVGRK